MVTIRDLVTKRDFTKSISLLCAFAFQSLARAIISADDFLLNKCFLTFIVFGVILLKLTNRVTLCS